MRAAVEERGVARVVQHLHARECTSFTQTSSPRRMPRRSRAGKEQSVLVEVLDGRAGRARLFEGREEGPQDLLNLTIRIENDPVSRIVNETDGIGDLSSPRRALLRIPPRTGAKNVKLGFRKCSLHSREKPVVEVTGIVEPVLVEDQGVAKAQISSR